jgi:NTE family protein
MNERLAEALKRVPPEALRPGEKEFVADCSKSAVVNIVRLIYQHKYYEGHARDYEFSGTSMREHWDSGYEDTLRTLRHPEWLERSAISRGVTVHDLHREDPT